MCPRPAAKKIREKCGQRNEHRRIELGKKYDLHPLRPLRIFERHTLRCNFVRYNFVLRNKVSRL